MVLFKKHGLNNTVHPASNNHSNLVKGYTEQADGSIIYETNTFNNYVPAGGFISTAYDLVKWNALLYNGQLVSDSTYELMSKRYATRKHPIFSEIEYGYGLLFKDQESQIQIGALGFTPGFVSTNYYFPKTKTSLIVLENMERYSSDFKDVFYHHMELLNWVNGH